MVKDLKTDLLKKNMDNLEKSIAFMKEDLKLLNKKMEFMQDNNARIAVEQQAVAEAVRYIVSIADKMIEQRKKQSEPGKDGIH